MSPSTVGQGGADLRSENDGVYYVMGVDDVRSYHELGRLTVPVAEGFVAGNTLVTIEHGELTILARSFIP